ncbi:MAG: sugar phosphate isomerase/epimerase, partial [Desulfobacterales bacterium]|nr:sugar phosphate isomerase/epimerase [Desulfobacterales bacterium]
MHQPLPKSYKNVFPFRLCTTSFIYPDRYAPNVRMLGPFVDEVELLLFESAPESLPTSREIQTLAGLAREFDLTFNIHLPTDISLCDPDPSRARGAAEIFRRIIRMTGSLSPTTYTLHLPYDQASAGEDHIARWRDAAHEGVASLLEGGVESRAITIETLDYPLDWAAPVISDLDLSVCLDIGHLVIHGFDPRRIFAEYRDQTTLIHL